MVQGTARLCTPLMSHLLHSMHRRLGCRCLFRRRLHPGLDVVESLQQLRRHLYTRALRLAEQVGEWAKLRLVQARLQQQRRQLTLCSRINREVRPQPPPIGSIYDIPFCHNGFGVHQHRKGTFAAPSPGHRCPDCATCTMNQAAHLVDWPRRCCGC